MWIVAGLLACGAPPSEAEPEVPPARLGGDGPELVRKRIDRPFFNSNPDMPVTFLTWKGHEGQELFIDGESVGVVPVTKALSIGDHSFAVLVGPGDKVAVQRKVVAKPGILRIELGS